MKIACIVLNKYIHDARVQRTAEALNEKYFVKVYGLSDSKVSENGYLNEVEYELIGLSSKQFSFGKIALFLKFIEYFFRTLYKLCKYKPDIVYVNNVHTMIFGYIFHLLGKKVIYDSHEYWKDSQLKNTINSTLFKKFCWLERTLINKFDIVITVGEKIARLLQNDHNINKPYVIMNISKFSDKLEQNNIIREKLHLSPNNKIVLYIGAISEGRGLDKIIESVNFWEDDIIFAILGWGMLEPFLKKHTDQLKLQNRVFFLGLVPQEEVLGYSASCDVGIMAIQNTCLSYYNCLPNKFFQILQQKKPILASNFPELEKIINTYNLGLTFDSANSKSIAEIVNSFFNKDFKISDTDYNRFIQNYNWENEKKKLLKLVKKLEE